jgi:C1A family cysteine protease
MATYKLSWLRDSGQPGTYAVDQTLEDNLSVVQSLGSAVSSPVVETNGVLDLRKWCAPIDNQEQLEDCVADSSTSALEFCQIRDGHPFVKKSRLFLYYNARLQTGDTNNDEGTYIRLAFSTLTSLGTCTEATWPYDPSQVFTRPSWGSYQEATPNKTAAYYRVANATGQALVTSVKQALVAQHVVVFGMDVDDAYMSYAGGLLAMPSPSRTGVGGHAQVIVGYDNNQRAWIVRNSWGTTWGAGGYAYVPWGYLDASQANDFWCPTL